ncbi:hypothetical protein [Parafrankia sp. Ea1.12]|nr:hypothetical protein [Parafrankia sp. Ea1.12]
MQTQLHIRPSSFLAVLLVAAVSAACSSDGTDDGAQARSPSPTRSPASIGPSTPSPTSASPTMPVAKDGTDLNACTDGECEVQVTAPTDIALPATSGATEIHVTLIEKDTVHMVIALDGGNFRSDGGCTSTLSVSTTASSQLTCHNGERNTSNGVTVEVGGIASPTAVIRVRTTSWPS